jgi:hypothetical protein
MPALRWRRRAEALRQRVTRIAIAPVLVTFWRVLDHAEIGQSASSAIGSPNICAQTVAR